MKYFALVLSALCCLFVVPSAAHADTYNFTLTPVSGGASTTFSLITAGVVYGADTVFTSQTGSSTVYGRVDLYNGNGYAPFDLALCLNGNAGGCIGTDTLFLGTPLDASVSGGGVSILTGTFTLVNFASGVPTLLTVVDATTTSVAVTPEPSSLMLLGTGLLGVAGVIKRRLA